MARDELLRVNFTLSDAAKLKIDALRSAYDQEFPDDKASVLFVGWGALVGADPATGSVVTGFYPQSRLSEVRHAIQEVSGVPFVYFTVDRYHPIFEGKVVDYSEERLFFLRDP